jgi:hypothetical protein
VQATAGNSYGSTGAQGAIGNGGTLFAITPPGTLTMLYSFCPQVIARRDDAPTAGNGLEALIQGLQNPFDLFPQPLPQGRDPQKRVSFMQHPVAIRADESDVRHVRYVLTLELGNWDSVVSLDEPCS